MAIARVQFKKSYPLAATQFDSNVVAGNLILAVSSYVSNASPPSPTFSDTSSNVYNYLTRYSGAQNGSQIIGITVGYAMNIAGGVRPTVTFGTGGASYDQGLMIVEYSGLATTSALGMTPITTVAPAGATTTPTSGSFTPVAAGNLLVAVFSDEDTALTSIAASGSGWNIIQASVAHNDADEDNLSCSAGAQTAAFTLNATSNKWAMMVLELKAVAAAAIVNEATIIRQAVNRSNRY